MTTGHFDCFGIISRSEEQVKGGVTLVMVKPVFLLHRRTDNYLERTLAM
jgi:hypothetical protein